MRLPNWPARLLGRSAAPPPPRSFDSAGVAIDYVDTGTPADRPIVLLHGYTGDFAGQWVDSGVFDALRDSHRVIGFDARGHGGSGKPHDPAAYGVQMALDVVRLLDHLDLQRAHIVGYSMGAHLVAKLLTLHPERFLTATLAGGCGRRDWTPVKEERVRLEAAEMDRGLLRAQTLRLWPAGLPAPTEDEIRAWSARALTGKDPHALAAVRRSNRDQVVTDAQMRAVTVPTLGLVGSRDPYLADLVALAARMPALTLVRIPGATHASAPSHPAFVRALRDFVDHDGRLQRTA